MLDTTTMLPAAELVLSILAVIFLVWVGSTLLCLCFARMIRW